MKINLITRAFFMVLILKSIILPSGYSTTQSVSGTSALDYDPIGIPEVKPRTFRDFKNDSGNFKFAVPSDRKGGVNSRRIFNRTMAQLNPQRFDPVKLARLSDGLAALGTRAFLVVRGDRILHEYYESGFGLTHGHYTASLAKAMVGSIVLSIALDDKTLALDESVSTYLPSWKADPNRSKITIRHLATHTSGLEDSRHDDNKKSADENDWKNIYWRDRSSRVQLAMTKASLVHSPGSLVLYSNPGFSILSYIVAASLSESKYPDIYDLLHHRIMKPLGIPDKTWMIGYGEFHDINGIKVYALEGGGLFQARGAARIGQLMLRRGSWGGRQLLSPETVKAATTSAAPNETSCPSDHPMLGLGWWTNANGVWPSLPRDAFVGAGGNHQLLLVIPSLDLVVVRFGRALSPDQTQQCEQPLLEASEKIPVRTTG